MVPLSPTGTVTMLGSASASPCDDDVASTLMLEAVGSAVPCGYNVQNPVLAGPTTVTLRTAALIVPLAGSLSPPVTGISYDVAAPNGEPPRVSARRTGAVSGTNIDGAPAAACTGADAPVATASAGAAITHTRAALRRDVRRNIGQDYRCVAL